MAYLFLLFFLLSLLGLVVGLINPKLVIRWGDEEKKTRGMAVLTYFAAMALSLGLIGVTADSTIKQEQEKTAVAPTPTAGVILPQYSVLNEEISDSPGKTQVELKILVSDKISEAGLNALLNQLYSGIKTRRGFTYHDSPTLIAIYAYASKEYAENPSQWIAMLFWGPLSDKGKPDININERQIAQLGAKPEERFGLSEEKRRKIWRESVLIEDRATREAEQQYPSDTYSLTEGQSFQLTREIPMLLAEDAPIGLNRNIRGSKRLSPQTTIKILKVVKKERELWYFVDTITPLELSLGTGWIYGIALVGQGQGYFKKQLEKQMELEERLMNKYRNNLAKKYGLTNEQLGNIRTEAFTKDWIFPKMASDD